MGEHHMNSIRQEPRFIREMKLRKAATQFIRGEISAEELQGIENEHDTGLRDAVITQARRNIKHRET